ncbi:AAA family ATPase [Loigolactobacillus iwatensis]|uniref:AAA family ATPase n=1 Tax=Loigolactobacillus iwatensis TaxID=1267156 RepID=UPI000F7EA181|nr:SMC family ATPase [Loigolactobacillus iwatensis]
MQPLSLLLENFGPYEHETIDFTKFTETPVFLISGKTGSGKTTIFDAMCYALFNQTSGADRDGAAMRSNFAATDAQTKVTFWFTHGQRRYRICRQPEQTVPKKRGGGFRQQPAKVSLSVFKKDEELTELTKAKKVQEYVQDLLQLDANQFSQIVLLPQGEFRQFLTATSDDKEKVLRRLFNTQFYADWAQMMKTKLHSEQKDLLQTQEQIETLQQQLIWQPDFEQPQAGLPIDDVLQIAKQQQAQLKVQIEQQKRQLEQAKQAVQLIQNQTALASQLSDWQQQTVTLKKDLAALTEKKPAMKQLTSEIASLEWAKTQRPKVQQLEQSQAELAKLQKQVQLKLTAFEEQQLVAKTTNATFGTLTTKQAEQQERQHELDKMQQLRPLYQKVTLGTKQVAQLKEKQIKLQTAVDEKQQQLSDNEEQQQNLNKQLANQPVVTAKLDTIAGQQTILLNWRDELEDLRIEKQKLVKNEQDLVTTGNQTSHSEKQVSEAKQAYQQLNSQWAQAQIARLSQSLLPGTPCPVCGAVDHPKPAPALTSTLISEAEVQQAETKLTQERKKLAQRQTEFSERTVTLKQAKRKLEKKRQSLLSASQDTLSGVNLDTNLTDFDSLLTKKISALKMQKKELEQELQRLSKQQILVEQFNQKIQGLQADLMALQQQQQISAQQLVKETTKQQSLQEQVPVQFSDESELQKHLESLEQQITAFAADFNRATTAKDTANQQLAALKATMTANKQQLQQLKDKVAKLQQQVTEALRSRWTDRPEQQFKELLAKLATLDEKRQTLQTFHDQRLQKQTQLDHLNGLIDGRPRPDLEKLQQQLAKLEEQVTASSAHFYQSEANQQTNEKLLKKINQCLAAKKSRLQLLAQLNQLSNVANGDGENKVSLERYVLQTYLTEVLLVANQRLSPLTNGRYQLQLHETTGTHRNHSGLEIDVYDDNVGALRSVHTLSGGESFIAALALALALGEVIQNETGSVEIDALFIDEGFGSLDEEALEMAMTALETIEGKNRMIGIISHVKELQEQVPFQLQVISDGGGKSHVRYQMAFAGQAAR